MKTYFEKHHKFYGRVGALVALAIALIYIYVVPEVTSAHSLIQRSILLYGHSLCWFLLSGASILWSIKRKNKWSIHLLYAALTVYVIFLSTLLVVKPI